jgi:hypothetical protein
MIQNNPNQRKAFLIAIVILLSLNVILLAFLLLGKEVRHAVHRPDRKAMISNFLKTEIGFDQHQLLQYDSASNRYRSKIKHLAENFGARKNEQFKKLLSGNFSDSVVQLLVKQSAAAHNTMEENMFAHIKNVRQLCKPSQLPAFDSLFGKVFGRRGEGNKNINK